VEGEGTEAEGKKRMLAVYMILTWRQWDKCVLLRRGEDCAQIEHSGGVIIHETRLYCSIAPIWIVCNSSQSARKEEKSSTWLIMMS
jgi:hypothetical protein